jgi:hypothetical protein
MNIALVCLTGLVWPRLSWAGTILYETKDELQDMELGWIGVYQYGNCCATKYLAGLVSRNMYMYTAVM